MDCGGTPGGAGDRDLRRVARLSRYRGVAAGGLVVAALAALLSIGYPGVKAAVAAYGYGYQYGEAHLIVIKHVVNDDSGTSAASAFTMTISGVTATGGNSFPGAESPGTNKTVTSGSYAVTETGPAGYVTSFSAGCSGTIAPSETKTCTLTNNDLAPRRTPGFWTNRPAEIERLLPQKLGNYTVDTSAKAIPIINSNCNKDPIGCLAGKLLVAKLNLAHGSFPCITPTVQKTDTFLSGGTVTAGGVTAPGVNYHGPGTYAITNSQKMVARTLAAALGDYNASGSSTSCTNP